MEGTLKEADPLRELIVDAAEVDRKAISEVLRGLVSIDGATGRLIMSPGYGALDSYKKVLIALLGRKAAHLLELPVSEVVPNKEFGELTGLPPGTSAPALKKLREIRLVTQDEDKCYYVPNAQMRHAIDYIVKGGQP